MLDYYSAHLQRARRIRILSPRSPVRRPPVRPATLIYRPIMRRCSTSNQRRDRR
ncbi:hypothetical protein PGTUg99_013240 [Puccinia graminis f. sp. tritici]|uniref:Uncharacterized protein n=1 Tax=Puccinia graminis f. sp. tritici TaxID=56615 RepID=A0A5B0S7G7_PUCGR|nr:hypothetical protein PGTUg99_013240 [Puccinia graminis f. sp. tritici]